MNPQHKIYDYWLSSINGIGSRKIRHLLDAFGTPEDVFAAPESQIAQVEGLYKKDITNVIASRDRDRLLGEYDMLEKKGIHFVSWFDEAYPDKLLSIDTPPFSLFYKGNLPKASQPLVAVVGARNASYGGMEIARRIGRELAENGIAVISGLARGVDIASQRGVLTVAGGRTYGVMGCGIDLCYPQEHIESYMMMQEYGGILSEFCPGVPPMPRNFPMRNRIISGLADGVLVVEAGDKSGSLITAELAVEQGKDVFVVPGDIDKPSYAGSNHLIQNGAALVTKTRDILDALGIFLDEDASCHKKKCEVMLESTEKIVYSYLGLEPIHISELSRRTGCSVPHTMELLLSMELKGVVKQIGNQYYALVL
jgi:DNA processing protein